MEQALDMPFSLLNPPGAYSPLSAAYSNLLPPKTLMN